MSRKLKNLILNHSKHVFIYALSLTNAAIQEDNELDNEVCELLYGVSCKDANVNLAEYNDNYGVGSLDEYDSVIYDTIDGFSNFDYTDYAPVRRVASYQPQQDSEFDDIDAQLAAIFGVAVEDVQAMEEKENRRSDSNSDDGEHSVEVISMENPTTDNLNIKPKQMGLPNKVVKNNFWNSPTNAPVTVASTTLAATTTTPLVTTTETTTTAAPTTKFQVPTKRVRCNNLKNNGQCEFLKPHCDLKVSNDEAVTTWMRVNCRDECNTCNQFLFDNWSEWSECSGARCSGTHAEALGQAARKRVCYDGEGDRSNECLGDEIEYKKCTVKCNKAPKPTIQPPKTQLISGAKNQAPCLDNLHSSNCQRLLQNGQCRNPAIAYKCQKTCMACPKSGITDKTVILAPDADPCFDKDERCDTWDQSKCTNMFKIFMKENCPKRCGFCTPQETTEPIEENIDQSSNSTNATPTYEKPPVPKTCKDAEKNICDMYKHKCNEDSVQKYCPVTCKLCTPPPEITQSIADIKKPDCNDQLGVLTCKRYKDNCENSSVANICKRTCGKCPVKAVYTKEEVDQKTEAKPTPKPPQKCADANQFYCMTKKSECSTNLMVKMQCRKSCGVCFDSPATDQPIQLMSQPKPNVCKDNNQAVCMMKRNKCGDPVWDNMCKATCGKCPGNNPMGGASACADKSPMCKMMASKCKTNPAAKITCPVTCGVCKPQTTLAPNNPMSQLAAMMGSKTSSSGSNPMAALASMMGNKSPMTQPQANPFSQLTKPTTAECKDKSTSCAMMVGKCDQTFVYVNCMKTCGKCPNSTPNSSPVNNNFNRNSLCKDQNKAVCQSMRSKCGDKNIKMMCRETCNNCPSFLGGASNNNSECKDSKSMCSSMGKFCDNGLIATQCQKTCGKCAVRDDGEHSAASSIPVNPMAQQLAAMQSQLPTGPNKWMTMITQMNQMKQNAGPKVPSPVKTPVEFKPIMPSKGNQGCTDLSPMCSSMLSQCSVPTMQAMCPQTCGKCASEESDTITAPTSAPKTSPAYWTMPTSSARPVPKIICADSEPELCAGATDMCEIPEIADKCRKTCNNCPEPEKIIIIEESQPDKEETCKDGNPACPMMTSMCTNGAIKDICKLSCKVCSTKTCVDFDVQYCQTLSDDDCKIGILQDKCPSSCGQCGQKEEPAKPLVSLDPNVCADRSPICPSMKDRCNGAGVKTQCPLTCNSCGDEKPTTTAAPIDTRPQPVCADESPLCDVLKAECDTNAEIRRVCNKTCNACPTLPPLISKPVCKDISTFCSILVDQCNDEAVSSICKNTCNKCDEVDETPKPTQPTIMSSRPSETCRDINAAYCAGFKDNCDTSPQVKRMCKYTCNACDESTGTEQKKSETCKDVNELMCSKYIGQCHQKVVKDMCKKTCKACGSNQTDATEISSNEPKESECSDSLGASQCAEFKEVKQCNNSVVQKMCQKTCDACSSESSTKKSTEEEKVCEDTSSKCYFFKKIGQCHTPYVKEICMVTCEVCTPAPTTKPETTTTVATTTPEISEEDLAEFVCEDKSSACATMAQAGMCSPNYKDLCTKSCEYCELAKAEFIEKKKQAALDKQEVVECTDAVPQVCNRPEFQRDLRRYCTSRHFRPNCRKSCREWFPCVAEDSNSSKDPENPDSDEDETEGEHSWQASTGASIYTNRNPIVTNWGMWSSCSVSCGGGKRSRTRVCRNLGPATNHRQPEECGVPLENIGACGKNACLEPIDESSKPKSCCRRLSIQSSEPKRSQTGRYGQYELVEDGTYNNRSVYKTVTDDGLPEFMYYMQLKRGGMWLVGPELGKGGGGLLVRILDNNKHVCANEAPLGTWKYYSVTDGWQPDESLTAICDDTPQCQDDPKVCSMYGDSDIVCKDPAVLFSCPIKCGKCKPAWTAWSEWSECSEKCQDPEKDMPHQTRTRICHAGMNNTTNVPLCGEGESELKRDCAMKLEPCVEEKSWSEWSECSISCRNNPSHRGFRERKQVMSEDDESEFNLEKEKCGDNLPICPHWDDWTDCSIECKEDIDSYGTKSRYSTNLNQTEVAHCGTEFPLCSEYWSDWSECSILCKETPDSMGEQTRFINSKPEVIESRTCGSDLEICEEWSFCSMPCGGGEQYRGTEVKACNTQACDEMMSEMGDGDYYDEEQNLEEDTIEEEVFPDYVTVSSWSDWKDCSTVCNGVQSRTRTCASTVKDACLDIKLVETRECNTRTTCLTEWSEWSGCSQTCNTKELKGIITRTRTCLGKNPNCRNDNLEEQKFCNLPECIQSEWDAWTEWTECTCDTKKQSRTRNCINGIPGSGGCLGDIEEVQECNCDDTGSLDELFVNEMPFESLTNNDSGSLDNFPSLKPQAEEEPTVPEPVQETDVNAIFDKIEEENENSGSLDTFKPAMTAVEEPESPTPTESEDSGSLDSFFEKVPNLPEVVASSLDIQGVEDVSAEEVAAEEVAAEKVAAEEVTAEEVAAEEVAAEEVAAGEVAAEEVAAGEVAAEEVAAEEVAAEEVAAEEVVTENVSAEEVAADEVLTEEVATEEVVAKEVGAKEVAAEEVIAEEVIAEEVTAEEVTAEEVTAEEVAAEEVIVEDVISDELSTSIAVDAMRPLANNDEDLSATANPVTSNEQLAPFELNIEKELVSAEAKIEGALNEFKAEDLKDAVPNIVQQLEAADFEIQGAISEFNSILDAAAEVTSAQDIEFIEEGSGFELEGSGIYEVLTDTKRDSNFIAAEQLALFEEDGLLPMPSR